MTGRFRAKIQFRVFTLEKLRSTRTPNKSAGNLGWGRLRGKSRESSRNGCVLEFNFVFYAYIGNRLM